jgi:hypothetical protein
MNRKQTKIEKLTSEISSLTALNIEANGKALSEYQQKLEILSVLEELALIVQAHLEDEEEMDSFTLQPAKIILERYSKELKALDLEAKEFHPCLTGDCPHWEQKECDEELAKAGITKT